jgi:hypothetical protein
VEATPGRVVLSLAGVLMLCYLLNQEAGRDSNAEAGEAEWPLLLLHRGCEAS